MKCPTSCFAALITLAVPLTATAQQNPRNIDTAANPRGSSPASAGALMTSLEAPVHLELRKLWKDLSGTYEQGQGDSRVSVDLKAISPYSLSVQARTPAGLVERGVLVLGDASTSYRSSRIRFAMQYRPDSFRSEYSCTLFGFPTAQGFTFESEGGDCSFVLGRRVSKVKIDVSRSRISISAGNEAETAFLRRPDKS
jgi:hypothetical protein